MGCWYGTCAVTNLPIHEYEEVEVILLRTTDGNPADQSAVTPYMHYLPLPLTFSGTYNDYGAVTNCEGVALDIILDAVRDNLMECSASEDERYTDAITKDLFNIDALFELDHEQRLYIKNPVKFYKDSPDYHRLRHIVVRKDVYDGIVNKTKHGRWWDNKNTTYAKLDVTEITKDIDAYLVPEPIAVGDSEEARIRRSIKMFAGVSESFASELISYKNRGLYTMSRPISPMEILTDLRGKNSPLYDDVLDNAIRFGFFDTFMNNARKVYMAPSGVGSQDESTKGQELCARLTLSSAKAQRKWLKDKYED